jgi:hypothetical protein
MHSFTIICSYYPVLLFQIQGRRNNGMPTSRGHQGAHGIGQAEEQLNNQAQAAVEIQGESELDQEVLAAANQQETELDEVIPSDQE